MLKRMIINTEKQVKQELDCTTMQRQLQVAITKTKNLGNYESLKIHVGLSWGIEDNSNIEEAYSEMFDLMFDQINKQEELLKGE